MIKKLFYIILIVGVLILVLACRKKENSDDNNNNNPIPSGLIQPEDLVYVGAFRLPNTGSGNIIKSWSWGGFALTYRNGGDPDNTDNFPGSLFGTGHAWEYQISEVSIPVPVILENKNLQQLNTARTLQDFKYIVNVKNKEIPRVGIEFLPKMGNQKTAKLYLCWGEHLQNASDMTHGWCEINLSIPLKKGDWYLNVPHNEYNTNDYLFKIPSNWADKYVDGRRLATGRFRDGGWSGQGPSLFAIAPWDDGNPPPDGKNLSYTTLLRYKSTEDYASEEHTMENYHHSDEWSGAVWLTTEKKAAVIFIGTKGLGDCWYGDSNGPCIECEEERGWWSSEFRGRIIFYDPSELAQVSKGEKKPYEPQPYAFLDIDKYLYHIESNQQWYHLGAVAFDRGNSILYIFEPYADRDKPIIHVWKIKD